MDGQMFFKTLMMQNQSSPKAPIKFSGGDETNSFPVMSGSEVDIRTSGGDHEVGSSKLKIKNIVNFGWEHKYYQGQVVGVHKSGNYLAYAITKPGTTEGIVRVVNRVTDERTLIKGMRGPVLDLAFAHIDSEVILGCVDSQGNMFVNRITEDAWGKLVEERVLEVMSESVEEEALHHLIWCPFLPDSEGEGGEEDSESDSSAARLLVLTHGSSAQIWSLDLVREQHGAGPVLAKEVSQGLLSIPDVGGDILDAAFSPDGSALAIASSEGSVKFFQVYLMQDGSEGGPRCIHTWVPHGGQPVSSLYFLDDHPNYVAETQVWKYAVTGCNHNRELKVWSCVSWTCLQTVSLASSVSPETPLRLKSGLDPTAKYLLLSDIDHSLVYVLGLNQDAEGARVVSVSEFATPAPFLSFFCVSAGVRMVEQTTEGVHVSQDNNDAEDPGSGFEKTVVNLYLVQPKSLQECSIIYEDAADLGIASKVEKELDEVPNPSESGLIHHMKEECDNQVKPIIHPLSQSSPRGSSAGVGVPSLPLPPPSLTNRPNSNIEELAEAASKITLLSPDQFKLSGPLVKEGFEEIDTHESELSSPLDSDLAQDVPLLETVEQDVNSGNSSPSREVADILAEDKPDFREDDGEESPDQVYDDDSSSPPQTFNTSKLNLSSSVFPTPPIIPPPVTAPSDQPLSSVHLEKMINSLNLQMKSDRELFANNYRSLDEKLDILVAHRKEEGDKLGKRLEVGMKQMQEKIIDQKTNIAQVIEKEIKRTLPGIVNRSIDGMIAGTEKKVEFGVKEGVGRMLASQATKDGIARAVAGAVQDNLKNCITETYKVLFQQQMVGFERSMGSLLGQVNEQFRAGTREYEALLGRREVAEEAKLAPHVAGLGAQVQELGGKVGSVVGCVQQLQAQQQQQGQREKSLTADQVREIVRQEVGLALTQSPAHNGKSPRLPVVQSGADLRHMIQGFVQSGEINEAFQMALSASSLELVVFTCDLLNTTQVFSSEVCPLSQRVLLSLIQQLAVDLSERTELKHNYLHEALVHLDREDPTIQVHSKAVLQQVSQSLQSYIRANPTSKMTRNLKLLAMAAESHLK